MDAIDIEIIRLLVRDKGGVMERRSWKSICKTLEARPTVRAKRPVQQAKAKISPYAHCLHAGPCPDSKVICKDCFYYIGRA